VKAGTTSPVAQDLVVDSPHLWAGLSDPYLYHLVVAVKDASGNAVDKVAQRLGVREMRFDANQGFFLNGKSVPCMASICTKTSWARLGP
jgi:beta-galactosidase